ncbi:hypothetical protein, partial [Stakelama sediminis]|uniref:hypothetical protein n=1 Tax=Stakelama sediminis TaxID=463200 RepID=UPI0031F0B70B
TVHPNGGAFRAAVRIIAIVRNAIGGAAALQHGARLAAAGIIAVYLSFFYNFKQSIHDKQFQEAADECNNYHSMDMVIQMYSINREALNNK